MGKCPPPFSQLDGPRTPQLHRIGRGSDAFLAQFRPRLAMIADRLTGFARGGFICFENEGVYKIYEFANLFIIVLPPKRGVETARCLLMELVLPASQPASQAAGARGPVAFVFSAGWMGKLPLSIRVPARGLHGKFEF